MPISKEKDLVVDAIRKALRAAVSARQVALEDTRSSSTSVCSNLESAVQSISEALNWMAELIKEVQDNEKPEIAPPALKSFCNICEEKISGDEVAFCEVCGELACPDCMKDSDICVLCAGEDEE